MTIEREKEIRSINEYSSLELENPLKVRNELLAEIDHLRDNLDIAVKALEFYANDLSYLYATDVGNRGIKAKEAITKIRGEK